MAQALWLLRELTRHCAIHRTRRPTGGASEDEALAGKSHPLDAGEQVLRQVLSDRIG